MKRVYYIVIVMINCLFICACGLDSDIKKAKEKMNNFISDEVIADLNKTCGINDLTFEIEFEDGYKLSDEAHLDCKVELISEDIERYSDLVISDKEKIEELLNIFRRIYAIRDDYEYEKTHFIFGENEIGFNFLFSDYFSTIIIEGCDGNVYEYGVDSDYEHLYLNSTVLYEKIEESYGKNYNASSDDNNEYIGSYDATLEYGSGSVLICVSEDAMDRYMTAINKGYQGTLDEMFSNGEIAYTEKNTKCNIIEKKLTRCQVKLLDGSYAGNTVWTIIEALQEKK